MAEGFKLIEPKIQPVLDPEFKPAVLANHNFLKEVEESGQGMPLKICLERNDGIVSVYETMIFGPDAGRDEANRFYVERTVKFLLWQRGAWKITIAGSQDLADYIAELYKPGGERQFDADLMGDDVYDETFAVEGCAYDDAPAQAEQTMEIGGHLEGCRVGFDLGASDRKASAVVDGEVLQ